MNIKHDDWISTYTGKQFWLLNPTPDMVDIEDIAHALSNTCRFAGHCKSFYSVAEHSVYVSRLVEPESALAALLHDASEAYIADIASPFKPMLENYKDLEDGVMKVVAQKFNFEYPLNANVKEADIAQLKAEAFELLTKKDWAYEDRYSTPNIETGIIPTGVSPPVAKRMFIDRFNNIMKGINNDYKEERSCKDKPF